MTKEQIGKILKEMRTNAALTPSDVVLRLKEFEINISEKTLYGYENGHSSPQTKTLFRLCDIYGVKDVGAAFGFDAKKEPATVSGDGLSKGEAAMLKLFRMVPAESQGMVLDMIEAALRSQGLLK